MSIKNYCGNRNMSKDLDEIINSLKQERMLSQKKTFQRLINCYLETVKQKLKVNDLYEDLSDGIILHKLLEVFSGKKLCKLNMKPRSRFHKIENVNKCLLEFWQLSKCNLENFCPAEIVDGKPLATLALIWRIIDSFQLKEIKTNYNGFISKITPKDILLQWVQTRTKDYSGVVVRDFSKSWYSGLAFQALIHAQQPDLFKYQNCSMEMENLNNCFQKAYEALGIPKLLLAEEVLNEVVDDKSVMTYVSLFYHLADEANSKNQIVKVLIQHRANKLEIESVKENVGETRDFSTSSKQKKITSVKKFNQVFNKQTDDNNNTQRFQNTENVQMEKCNSNNPKANKIETQNET